MNNKQIIKALDCETFSIHKKKALFIDLLKIRSKNKCFSVSGNKQYFWA
jgi:hypothetical protein